MFRRGLVRTVALLATVLAWPALSSAAQSPVLVSGPVRVQGYELTLGAGPTGRSRRASGFELTLTRRGTGGSEQSHAFSVTRGVTFKVARDLRSARLRASLGGYGRVELTVARATPERGRDCYTKLHRGVARGTLKLTPGGGYFGTIVRKNLPVRLGVPGGCASRRHIIRTASANRLVLSADGLKCACIRFFSLGFSSDLSVTFTRPGSRVGVEDTIYEPGLPSSNLTAASDLTSATLQAGGPFLAGVANYSATTASRPEGSGLKHTSGTISGTLSALFDTPGALPLTGSSFHAELIG